MKAYNKSVTYLFEVCDEEIEIVEFDTDYVELRETRCNGQEDTHMAETLVLVDGRWKWQGEGESWYRNSFVTYHSQELADDIVAYITKHGIPSDINS